ncbi:cytochrome P450 [Aspergillus aurantiobrunneus]
MAFEAALRLAAEDRPLKGVSFSDVHFDKGLVIPSDDQAVETRLSTRPHEKLPDWYHYTFSEQGKRYEALYNALRTRACRPLNIQSFYDKLQSIGTEYGPTFRNLEEAAAVPGEHSGVGTITIPDTKTVMPHNFEYPHLIHPATLDAIFHLIFVSIGEGNELAETAIPTSLDGIYISTDLPQGAGAKYTGFGRAEPLSRRDSLGTIVVSDRDWTAGPKIIVEGMTVTEVSAGIRDNAPFDVRTAYSCFTADVISKYCFEDPSGFVAQSEWEPNYRDVLKAIEAPVHIFRVFPFLKALTDIAPLFAKWASSGVREMLIESNERMPARIRNARQGHETGVTKAHGSIFTAVLDAPLPDAEKADWSELHDADALNIPWVALEKLAYLRAVNSEGLRLSYGVSQRLAQIASKETLLYRGEHNGRDIEYSIPVGTPMGMSNAINHHNEEAFPDSHAFMPERSLGVDEAQRRRMEACLTSFSKGSRQCLGINLAYCNLYRALFALALRVFPRMRLYETTVDDVRYDLDLFAPMPRKGSNGVRAIIS